MVAKADPPPKATSAVLLYEAPVAGRAVRASDQQAQQALSGLASYALPARVTEASAG